MADSVQIEIIDNSPKVKGELESAVLRALEKCGLTANMPSTWSWAPANTIPAAALSSGR